MEKDFDPATRTDFWNDPDRWEGIDPHKECFWMRRHVDVIDVRAAMNYTDSTSQFMLGPSIDMLAAPTTFYLIAP